LESFETREFDAQISVRREGESQLALWMDNVRLLELPLVNQFELRATLFPGKNFMADILGRASDGFTSNTVVISVVVP
jgi:hypothetical protein